MNKKEIIWKDRKRTIFGLPLSFTVYTMTREKLLIDTGFLNQRQEEVMLFRISDVTLHRSLFQRLFGVGTIHCCSTDKTAPEFDIINIKRSYEIKELLSTEMNRERKENRVYSREVSIDDGHDDLH